MGFGTVSVGDILIDCLRSCISDSLARVRSKQNQQVHNYCLLCFALKGGRRPGALQGNFSPLAVD